MSYEITKQPIYLYSDTRGQAYYFDGVLTIEHSVQLKIEDDPSNIKKKKEYTNNAKNDPDEVKIELVMSNVYTTQGSLSGKSGSRLKNAFTVLNDIKTQCELLTVVTSIHTYTNMLIKSLNVKQEESEEFWSGTLTLHQMMTKEDKKERTSKAEDAGEESTRGMAGVDELRFSFAGGSSNPFGGLLGK